MPGLPPIMLVDDDADDLFIVRRLLSKAGVQNKIVAFEDARAAVDHLNREGENLDRRFIPCVVITDLNMPAMTGLEVTRWIRTHPILRDLPVVMMTDSEEPAIETAAHAAGVTRFVRKYPTSQGFRLLLGDLPCSIHATKA